MMAYYLGIDVSKLTFDCCLQHDETGETQNAEFLNNESGYAALIGWLVDCGAIGIIACMEATGSYWQDLANALYPHCDKVAVENPAKIRHYARARLSRNKTDKLDASLIAQYARQMAPYDWHPPDMTIVKLRQHHQMLVRLKRQRASEKTKLHETPPELADIVQAIIANLDNQIKDMNSRIKRLFDGQDNLNCQLIHIQSVPGIGYQTASLLLSIFAGNRFTKSGQVVAYLGLNPEIRQSGTSINGKARISKVGKSSLRAGLYAPAMVAYSRQLYPQIIDRMKQRKKPPQVIIVALMRRLVVLAFTLWQRQEMYDKTKAVQLNQTA